LDKKIVVIALVAVIVVVAAVAIFMMPSNSNTDSKDFSVIGRVNSEGSGIILNPGLDTDDFITVQKEQPAAGAVYRYNAETQEYMVFHKEGWSGKVIATPGTSTIQHVQLGDLANEMGLTYKSYSDTRDEPNTLYYVANVASFADYVNLTKTTPLTGYIIWEAQVSVAKVSGYTVLALTNDLFEGHTCCIIGASQNYIKNNKDVLLTFLDVYADAVDKINAALADTASSDYEKLVNIAINRVTMPDSMTDAQKREAIISALKNVTYAYSDDTTGVLTDLKKDIAVLAESFYQAGAVSYSASDLGFKSYTDLANKFVVDTYIKDAVAGKYTKLDSARTINVAAIKGDIHQIALWFAIDTGMFEGTNLTVNVSQQNNGPGVFTQLSNGESDIGFLGAPPMTMRSMNAKLISP